MAAQTAHSAATKAMAPSSNDTADTANLDDAAASLGLEDAELVGEDHDDPPRTELSGEDADEIDPVDEDDGLAPEAGSRRPSALSVLLLAAGAIWIVVALLKLGGADAEDYPPMTVGEQVEADTPLPDIEQLAPDDDVGRGVEDKPPPETENSGEKEGVLDNPDLENSPEVGTPASERGPPEGSLLAGKSWPEDYVAPEVVHYTIKRGGSMKIVANLYKIFHHEIETLNPGVSLERELPPETKLVVYRRKPGARSQSIGQPGRGSIQGAMPMVDGPGRILKHTPWKGWATQTTVATMDLVLQEWARRFPNRQPILVGNMSARNGGRLKPHSSHQSGRDVDLSYPQIWDRKEELNWRTMNAKNLDRDLTWSLLELLRETGGVEVILIDSKIQRLLHEYALETGRYSKKKLESWMEYPRPPGSGRPLIQHVRGHQDHIHVRFECTAFEPRCESKGR